MDSAKPCGTVLDRTDQDGMDPRSKGPDRRDLSGADPNGMALSRMGPDRMAPRRKGLDGTTHWCLTGDGSRGGRSVFLYIIPGKTALHVLHPQKQGVGGQL